MQTVPETRTKNWLGALPWALAAVLLASNVATLVSAQAHSVGYGAVDRILSVLGDKVRLSILSSSMPALHTAQIATAVRDTKVRAEQAEGALRTFRQRVTELEADKGKLQRRLSRHREVATKVGRDGIRNLAIRSARAVTSAPVRMAPYVGIAAEVGFLAWEVNADCELAKALAELLHESESTPEDLGSVCGWVGKVPTQDEIWSSVKRSGSDAMRRVYSVIERTGL